MGLWLGEGAPGIIPKIPYDDVAGNIFITINGIPVGARFVILTFARANLINLRAAGRQVCERSREIPHVPITRALAVMSLSRVAPFRRRRRRRRWGTNKYTVPIVPAAPPVEFQPPPSPVAGPRLKTFHRRRVPRERNPSVGCAHTRRRDY